MQKFGFEENEDFTVPKNEKNDHGASEDSATSCPINLAIERYDFEENVDYISPFSFLRTVKMWIITCFSFLRSKSLIKVEFG